MNSDPKTGDEAGPVPGKAGPTVNIHMAPFSSRAHSSMGLLPSSSPGLGLRQHLWLPLFLHRPLTESPGFSREEHYPVLSNVHQPPSSWPHVSLCFTGFPSPKTHLSWDTQNTFKKTPQGVKSSLSSGLSTYYPNGKNKTEGNREDNFFSLPQLINKFAYNEYIERNLDHYSSLCH